MEAGAGLPASGEIAAGSFMSWCIAGSITTPGTAAPPPCPGRSPLEELEACVRSSSYFVLSGARGRRADATVVRHLVPEANHRLGTIVLVSHRAEAGGAENEVPAGPRL